MEIIYSATAQNDIAYWKEKKGAEKIRLRISELIRAITESPFVGIGKPEPLKYGLSGKWSRRIDRENRIVYSIDLGKIKIHSLRGHYK
ncbi:MAG: Txe/YoeB family addiction module toxin [Bacteroidetes bacterium]|nr:Txe/YoeB family addiction module toxin [Bacteroidota bacterium]